MPAEARPTLIGTETSATTEREQGQSRDYEQAAHALKTLFPPDELKCKDVKLLYPSGRVERVKAAAEQSFTLNIPFEWPHRNKSPKA